MWKLTSDKKLKNQNGDWLYSFKRWELPGEDKQGSIKDLDSGKVLCTLTTIKVSLEDEKDLLSIFQCHWTKSKEDSDGWFRLTIGLMDVKYSSRTSKSLSNRSKYRAAEMLRGLKDTLGKFRYLCAESKSRLTIAGL